MFSLKIPHEIKSSVAIYARLLTYVKPYKWVFALALVGMVATSVGMALFVWALKPIVDDGFVNQDMGAFHQILLILFILGWVRALGSFMDRYCMAWVGQRVVMDLRVLMFERLLYVPVGYYDHVPSSLPVAKLIYDVERVAMACTTLLRTLFKDVMNALALFAVLFYLNWQLSLVFMLVAPAIYYIFKYTTELIQDITRRDQRNMGGTLKVAKESFQGQRLIKIFNSYRRENKSFHQVTLRRVQLQMTMLGIHGLTVAAVTLVTMIAVVGVIKLALWQDFTAGGFAAYVTALVRTSMPITKFAQMTLPIQMAITAAESVFETIGLPKESDPGKVTLKRVNGEITFERVHFSYSVYEPTGQKKKLRKKKQPKAALRDVSLRIEAGSTVALVGVSGSGKSTITSLLLRFYAPTGGEIRIDGQPLNSLTLRSLRKHIAIIPQDVALFDDSIARNIAYDNTGKINQTRLKKAALAANIMEFVNELPDGLDTQVGERGLLLSGGQRQRIAIARALYKNAPILIMDEATSSLDSKSEAHIRSATERLTQNRTSIVIAHRLSTIQNADNIVVLDHGEVVEQGDHATLLKKGGAYAALYHAQFGKAARE